MPISRARLVSIALLAAAGVALTGCAAGDGETAPTATSSTPAASQEVASPAPSATLDVPETLPGEIARAVFLIDGGEGGTPETSYIATDLVQMDVPFSVTGECIGDSVDYEVVRAAVGDSGGVLVSGTIECGATNSSGSFSAPYAGPVQLMLKDTDHVSQAWVVVVPG
ncbi:hypothetical protein [Microbacterium sp.]|uniref:hypothetical protein n=1 Tax=Microbacterium sp. TaxID=51671 RepID=UPI003F6F19E9